ncbi:hypothetical protein, partial [Klebsiella quasipneumoniae]|uniref:hypothetical protein n=1 Tax=Klebsiella quasipneumoniae TaxID=1463165 RepID=UPI002148DCB6
VGLFFNVFVNGLDTKSPIPVKILLRSLTLRRNLLLCKRKNHPARWFFEGSETGKFLNRGNWLMRSAVTKTCSFSLALTGV